MLKIAKWWINRRPISDLEIWEVFLLFLSVATLIDDGILIWALTESQGKPGFEISLVFFNFICMAVTVAPIAFLSDIELSEKGEEVVLTWFIASAPLAWLLSNLLLMVAGYVGIVKGLSLATNSVVTIASTEVIIAFFWLLPLFLFSFVFLVVRKFRVRV